jgi:hypothetical protein
MSDADFALFLDDNRSAWKPGERLRAHALWALDRAPTTLEARLFWTTRGKGTEDGALVATQSLPHPAAAGEHTFEFTLPSAPYSFSGQLISLVWAVELVAEPGGRAERCEFVLAPEGREIVLHPADNALRA